jgi:peptidoglycan/xylan/chitin deacetylase (PgdA/CDA1 family)
MNEPRFCYKHPTRIAKRKCFQCSRPLCPDCQIKRDHHLFCTDLCHKNYQSSGPFKPVPRYARYALYLTGLMLVAGVIYFALLADAFYSGGDQPSAPKFEEIRPSLPVVVESEPNKETINITRPLNGMKSPSQIIEVEGKAPDHAVVAIYLNGTLIESTVARENLYRFQKVPLTKHANVIQTRFYSDNGSTNFSPAIMVLYQDELQSNSADWKFFQNSSDNISRGNVNRKELVLTFDGGSDANSCETILDTLKQYRVRSTIFLTGEFMEKFPEMTRRIAAEHEVGNHTYSHEHLTTYAINATQKTATDLTKEELQNQLQRAEEIYYLTTGKRIVPLWRAPYGEHNLEIRRWAAEIGYMHVAWTANAKNRQNMDSLDWVPNQSYPGYFPAQLIKDRLLSFGQNEPEQANGSILLMHLGSEREAQDRLDKWLPEILKTFRQRGYAFITASELIDHQDLLPNLTTAK